MHDGSAYQCFSHRCPSRSTNRQLIPLSRTSSRRNLCSQSWMATKPHHKCQPFFLSEPVAFRRVYGLESYSRTSGESNHHRQSVSDTRVPRYQLHHEDAGPTAFVLAQELAEGVHNQVKKGRCKFGFHSCMKCFKPGHGASGPSEGQFSRIAETEEPFGISTATKVLHKYQYSSEAEETDTSDPVGHSAEDNEGETIHNSALVLEIFAGSCRLSRTCRDVGFRVTAVEKDKQRAENFSLFACDVTKQEDAKQLMDYIEAESDSLVHAHFPSCGTCSRAREIKVPGLPMKDSHNRCGATSIQMASHTFQRQTREELTQQITVTVRWLSLFFS